MEAEARIREVVAAWRTPTDLAKFARLRLGFGDSNGGFGIIYPGDLDEYQREVEGLNIPMGMVEVYGYWGLPNGYEFVVREIDYLGVLADYLREQGNIRESEAVHALMVRSA